MPGQQSHDHAAELHAGGRHAQHGPAPFLEPVATKNSERAEKSRV
jgi:hypothetical protein